MVTSAEQKCSQVSSNRLIVIPATEFSKVIKRSSLQNCPFNKANVYMWLKTCSYPTLGASRAKRENHSFTLPQILSDSYKKTLSAYMMFINNTLFLATIS